MSVNIYDDTQGTLTRVDGGCEKTNETVLYNENNWLITYIRFGNVVTVHILRNATTTIDSVITSLPEGFRPMRNIGVRSYYGDAFCEVKANGDIRVKSEAQWIQFYATYVVA